MNGLSVTIQHSEATLISLSHMQYNLFCRRNRVARTLLSVGIILCAVLFLRDSWAFYLLVAYGCYLSTSTYSASNHTVNKTIRQLKASNMPFPSSRYEFESGRMRVFSLPDNEELAPLVYSQIAGLAEDLSYFYLFRDSFGGYMVSKAQLGDRVSAFRDFIERASGKSFYVHRSPIRQLQAWLRRRENEPYHL